MKKFKNLLVAALFFVMATGAASFAAGSLFHKEKISQTGIPFRVERLVKLDKGVSEDYASNLKEIMELFWNDSNGKLILSTLSKHKVKFNVVKSGARVYASEETISLSYSPSTANQGDTYNLYYINVDIPSCYISDYANKKLPLEKRLYSLGYVLHEFAHAYVYVKNPHNQNSIEQKLTLTMFGYDEANKILTGSYLTPAQSSDYSYIALKSIVDFETKKVPVYTGITKKLVKYGVSLQNTQNYSDITGMYNKLLSEGKIKPNISFQ